jgi:hypothetical protein
METPGSRAPLAGVARAPGQRPPGHTRPAAGGVGAHLPSVHPPPSWSPYGCGGDHGIDHHKNWLRFPYVSIILRSPYLPLHPYSNVRACTKRQATSCRLGAWCISPHHRHHGRRTPRRRLQRWGHVHSRPPQNSRMQTWRRPLVTGSTPWNLCETNTIASPCVKSWYLWAPAPRGRLSHKGRCARGAGPWAVEIPGLRV